MGRGQPEFAQPTAKDPESLDALFAPRSIAVIGASDHHGNLGYRLLGNLALGGYAGSVYPVSLRHDTLRGLPAYRAIGDIPGPVDLAVLAVPASVVPSVAEECVVAGVRSMLVLSAGFSEAGETERQVALHRAVEGSGTRIGGPNCGGFTNLPQGIILQDNAFSPTTPVPHVGPVAIVSQSGGVGTYLMRRFAATGLGLNWLITTGNEVDVELGSAIRYVVEKRNVGVVVCFSETIRDAGVFVAAVQRAAELDKPVVILKGARTPSSQRAAVSHTASLVGSAEVFDSVCRQTGVHVASSLEELLDLATVFANGRRARGSRAGILTQTGGTGVLLADTLSREGLSVPELEPIGQQSLASMLPSSFLGSLGNPIDLGTQSGDAFEGVLRWMIDSDDLDIVVPVVYHYAASQIAGTVAAFRDGTRPVAVFSTGPNEELTRAGVPVFTDPARLSGALAALVKQSLPKRPIVTRPFPTLDQVRIDTASKKLDALHPHAGLLEHQALSLLSLYGVPVARSVLAKTEAEAVSGASQIAGPVALKIVSYDLPHKTDVNGVRLGVEGPRAVAATFTELLETVAATAPDARLEGVLVQEIVAPRLELACGVQRDAIFGPMIMVGLGGSLIEIVGETTLIRPPFDVDEAAASVASLFDGRLTRNARGLSLDEVHRVADVMCSLANLVIELPTIESIDVNPLCVFEDQVRAVDALVLRREVSPR